MAEYYVGYLLALYNCVAIYEPNKFVELVKID